MSSWFTGIVQSIQEGDFQKVVDQTNAGLEQLSTNLKQVQADVEHESQVIKEQNDKRRQATSLPWDIQDESKSILIDDIMTRVLNLPLEDKSFTTEPTPPTEFDFDMDNHVNAIMKLMQIDPNLAQAHYRLSSRMDEAVFWRNYFHRCALIRAEIGVDPPLAPKKQASVKKLSDTSTAEEDDAALEAEVTAELEEHLGDLEDDLEGLDDEDFDADLEAEIAAELGEHQEEDQAQGQVENDTGASSTQSFEDDLALIDDEIERELADLGEG